jgi:hypothetical protein
MLHGYNIFIKNPFRIFSRWLVNQGFPQAFQVVAKGAIFIGFINNMTFGTQFKPDINIRVTAVRTKGRRLRRFFKAIGTYLHYRLLVKIY